MKKIKLLILLLAGLSLVLVLIPGCKPSGEKVITETVIETVTETVLESVEVESESLYTYEKLREMSEARAYEEEPAKGHKFAFANLY